jgi:hypothetical protein
VFDRERSFASGKATAQAAGCPWRGVEHRHRMVPWRYQEASKEMAAMCMGTYWAIVKFPLSTSWRCMWEWKYSSTHSKPRHWMGVSGELYVPAALPR